MPSCTDCGHAHRPGALFCTQCGKPAASPEMTGEPTSIVAVVVLAVGLLAFLSIGPMMPRQATNAVATAPVQRMEAVSIPDRGNGEADAGIERAVPLPHPDEPPSSAAAAVLEPPATAPVEAAMMPAEAAVVHGGAAAALGEAAVVSGGAAVVPGGAAVVPGGAAAVPGGAAVPGEEAAPREAVVAAPGKATPRAMPAAPEPAHSTREREARRATSVGAPERASPAPPRAPSSSPLRARYAAVDSSPSRGSAKARPTERGSWLRELRTELDACQGNFIARTICREKAKFRHCTPAGAWGEVPECPSERPPDVAILH